MGIIRLLLALAVLAQHSTPILGFHFLTGAEAVEIFFIISGFYMSLILRGKYGQREHSVRLFYQNRFLRLYPTYLICVLLTWGLFFGEYALMHKVPTNSWLEPYRAMGWWKVPFALSNLTMVGLDVPAWLHYSPAHGFTWLASPVLGNLADGSASCFAFITVSQAWSVGSEIWFYLMAPWLARRCWFLLLAPLAISLLIKYHLEHAWHYGTYFFFPAQCCFFLVGMLLHRFYERFQSSLLLPKCGWFGWIMIMIGILSLGWTAGSFMKYLFYTTFGLSLPAIFALSRRWTLDRHIGNLSYSVYLLHWIVIDALRTGLKINSGTISAILTMAGAILIYWLVERPIDAYRQRQVRSAAKA